MGDRLQLTVVVDAVLGKTLKTTLKTATEGTTKLGSAVKNVDAKMKTARGADRYNNQLGKMYRQQKNAQESCRKLTAGIGEVERTYKTAGLAADRYTKQVGSTIRAQQQLAKTRRHGALETIQRAAIPLGAAFVASRSIGRGMEFEHRLAHLENTGELTRQQSAEMRKRLIEISARANRSTTDLLEGVEFLVSKGLDPEQATQSIEPIGKTATAENASVIDLAKSAYAVIANMEVPEARMAEALDVIATAGAEGGFELKDMAQYLPSLTAASSGLVKGMEGLAMLSSSLQISAEGAGDASEAANNYRNFLLKLNAPETFRNFAKQGVDLPAMIDEAKEEGKNPVTAVLKKIKELQQADKHVLGQLFGDQQVLMFLNTALPKMEKMQAIHEKAKTTKGKIDKDFKNIMQTSTEQTRRLAIATENLSNSMSTTLLPVITPIAGKLAGLGASVAAFTEQHPAMSRFIGTTLVGIGVFGAAAVAIATMGWALSATPLGAAIAGIAAGAAVIWAAWEPLAKWWNETIGGWTGIVDKVGETWQKWFGDNNKKKVDIGATIKQHPTRQQPTTHLKLVKPGGTGNAGQLPPLHPNYAKPPEPGRRTGATITNSSQIAVTIHAPPGMDAKEIARLARKEIEKKEREAAEKMRGNNYAGAA